VDPANRVNRMSTKHVHVLERKRRLVHRVEPVLRISTLLQNVPGSKIGFVLIAEVPVLPTSMNLESVPRSTIGFVQHVALVARMRLQLKNAQQLRIPFACKSVYPPNYPSDNKDYAVVEAKNCFT